MQNKKIPKIFILSFIFAIIFTLARTVLLFTFFDFESKFFTNNFPVTLFYVSLILFSAIIYFFRKNYMVATALSFKSNGIVLFFNIFLAAIFLALTFLGIKEQTELTLLESITLYISVICGVFAVLYYIVSIFSKENFILILNIAPTLYFICITITDFIQQTGHANSYNDFSHILSLIALSFLVLEEGKAVLSKNHSILFPIYLICGVLISQSVLPDLITISMTTVTIKTALISSIKVIYLAYTITKLIILIKNSCEDK